MAFWLLIQVASSAVFDFSLQTFCIHISSSFLLLSSEFYLSINIDTACVMLGQILPMSDQTDTISSLGMQPFFFIALHMLVYTTSVTLQTEQTDNTLNKWKPEQGLSFLGPVNIASGPQSEKFKGELKLKAHCLQTIVETVFFFL